MVQYIAGKNVETAKKCQKTLYNWQKSVKICSLYPTLVNMHMAVNTDIAVLQPGILLSVATQNFLGGTVRKAWLLFWIFQVMVLPYF